MIAEQVKAKYSKGNEIAVKPRLKPNISIVTGFREANSKTGS